MICRPASSPVSNEAKTLSHSRRWIYAFREKPPEPEPILLDPEEQSKLIMRMVFKRTDVQFIIKFILMMESVSGDRAANSGAGQGKRVMSGGIDGWRPGARAGAVFRRYRAQEIKLRKSPVSRDR